MLEQVWKMFLSRSDEKAPLPHHYTLNHKPPMHQNALYQKNQQLNYFQWPRKMFLLQTLSALEEAQFQWSTVDQVYRLNIRSSGRFRPNSN